MRCIVGQIHREKILSFLPPGGRMLEWGAGGSTLWFANRLPTDATLTSVEHDPKWHAVVAENVGVRDNVRLLLRPAEGPLGRNATSEEENASPLTSYVRAAAGERFDVVLVDGYARSACLTAASDLLKPGGVVCLHDGQRSWYDQAKLAFTCWGVIGSCPDYEVPHLWFGGLAPASVPGRGSQEPVIISYFTRNTPYEEEARRLIASCEQLGLEHDVVGLPVGDSWEANCARKAEVCLAAWHRHRRPILWVDADATVLERPSLLTGCSADFAIHRWNDWQFASGTVFFNQSALALSLLERWVERCRQEPYVWDQVSLDLAWEEITARSPLETLWLPRSYYQIFDASPEANQPTVIQQHQASRRLKRVVSDTPPRPAPVPSEALLRARRASRPRRWLLPGPDSKDFEVEVAEERWLDAVPHGSPTVRLETERAFVNSCLREVEAELLQSRDTLIEERVLELAERLRARQPARFAIYGAGAVGQALLRVAQRAGLAPIAFVETDPARHGQRELDVPIQSVSECIAAGCHVYAIGSFASAASMIDVLNQAYAAVDLRYEVLLPQGPPPRLPDVRRATKTLLAGRASLEAGRRLAGAYRVSARPNSEYAAFVDAVSRLCGGAPVVDLGPDGAARLDALPFGNEAVQAAFLFEVLEHVTAARLDAVVAELGRVTSRYLFVRINRACDAPLASISRADWERRFFAAGWSKHPRYQHLTPYERLEHDEPVMLMAFERLPCAARQRHPLEQLAAERDLHMDMLRETGRRSDAHVARYSLAAQFVRPGDKVLDAACGLGYGTALLYDSEPETSVTGIDLSESAIAYARAVFASRRPRTMFTVGDVMMVGSYPSASLDVIASFETLEHLAEPDAFVAEAARVLASGGRFICSVPNRWVDETGRDPNPFHLHVFDLDRLTRLLEPHFRIDQVFAQFAGGAMVHPEAARRFLPVPPGDRREAEWWVVVATRWHSS
jgi:SAM-dependent methyltransferase